MTALNKQALRELAQKAGSDKWQAKKISGDFYVIRSGSFAKQYGITSYRPIAEIKHKPVRDYVAAASPATMLELLDELEAEKNMREAAEKRIAELSASHSKLREGMAAIYNAICENGASTSLSTILTFVKRSREESSTAAGIGVKGE